MDIILFRLQITPPELNLNWIRYSLKGATLC